MKKCPWCGAQLIWKDTCKDAYLWDCMSVQHGEQKEQSYECSWITFKQAVANFKAVLIASLVRVLAKVGLIKVTDNREEK